MIRHVLAHPRTLALGVLLVLGLSGALHAQTPPPEATDPHTLQLPVPGVAPDGLRVRVLLPPGYDPARPAGYPVLYVLDGQDEAQVGIRATLDALVQAGTVQPVVLVLVDAPAARIDAFGFSDRSQGRSVPAPFSGGEVGRSAHAFAEWLTGTLVPAIEARYHVRRHPEARGVLGWSLGGAAAFNLGWQYPEVFATVGAFSPSFWLSRNGRGDADARARGRIAQGMVDGSQMRVGARFLFAVGDAEETDDRDGDGVIDVLDDARDLASGWQVPGDAAPRAGGLRQLGYAVNADDATRRTRADVAVHVVPGGIHHQSTWARMLPAFLTWAYAVRAPALEVTGTLEGWQRMPSAHVPARNVDVWLPPSYGTDPARRYPVLYMHDGQNLFDPGLAYTGTDWDVDGAMARLIAAGEVREAIVVGVWNTPARFAEYMPKAPIPGNEVGSGIAGRPIGVREDVQSDAYLRFLVDELKPFIDGHYRTLPGQADTFVMGSSMGGLISLYALAQYPDVFGGVGAVSTHWPACDGCVIDWMATHLPPPGEHRLYFDFGTATLDALYPPLQARMDAALRAAGWSARDWTTRRFEGAEHNEAAWKARLDQPLRFLLGTPPR